MVLREHHGASTTKLTGSIDDEERFELGSDDRHL
jgi:hypothetical protein